ncbi:MAG: hypothetical protein RQ757_11190 [Pseudomonadales bacterium]|nr:hypothetical protein [Pseudomonadales bacterium]
MSKRRATEGSSIAFLDVISCGFGAIILLLMITESSAPVTLDSTVDERRPVAELQQELFRIRGETAIVNRELNAKQEQLSAFQQRLAIARRERSLIEARYQTSKQIAEEVVEEESKLALARQSLSEEMQRLLGEDFSRDNDLVGGIPVDSEYIIFVIDTSGSMFNAAWRKMLDIVIDTLEIYPEVKGIQIMNDMGEFMYNSYRNQWIPDTPGRRSAIISTLRNWNPFSNSSPVEGVTRAISSFYEPDKKISIYVLGDDFQPGGSITQVIETIDRINKEDPDGNRMVRIHAIGFPVIFSLERRFHQSAYRFASLMRELTQRNGGTFVGLNSFE